MKFVKPMTLKHFLGRKITYRRRHGLLGLHVGDKYVSLAMSDKESKSAVPVDVCLCIVNFVNTADFLIGNYSVLIRLQIQCENIFNLGGCIVGYRYIRSIEESEGVSEQIFIDNLCKTTQLEGLKYAYWDGRIISKDVDIVLKHHAEYLLDQLSLPHETLETILDKFAAVRTLQGYMDCANMLVEIDNLPLGQLKKTTNPK